MSIRQLPQDVVDRIKSSVVITSLNGVICGLLANALDAGASRVNISVDYVRGSCTVEDNGSGISPDEFKEDGGIGKLNHTSNFPPSAAIHGRHGSFLAALSTLSFLSITSRGHGHVSSSSVTFHNSETLSRHVPNPPNQGQGCFDHGTRVVVRDLFGSMPVRVKQRALTAQKSNLDKEWARLVHLAVALLLPWPSGVNIWMKNLENQRELRFRPSNEPDVLSRASRLLTQASLADSSDAQAWVPISASSGAVTVKGCICANPVSTRRTQFISLGISPIHNEFGTHVLYEEINRVFRNSSFGSDEEINSSTKNLAKGGNNPKAKELRNRKGVEKWPMFYLKIGISGKTDIDNADHSYGHGKTLAEIIDLLKAMCYGFLKKNHFRPHRVQLGPDESIFSTSRTLSKSKRVSKLPASSIPTSKSDHAGHDSTLERPGSPFDGWHRMKSSQNVSPSDPKPMASHPKTKTSHMNLLIGEGGKLLRKPFHEPSLEPEAVSSASSLAHNRYSNPDSSCDPTLSAQTRSSGQQDQPQHTKWLQKVVDSWENPVFESTQSSVPRIEETASLFQRHISGNGHQCGDSTAYHNSFEAGSVDFRGRISRQALANATVIAQVDRKFILIKLPLEAARPNDASAEKNSSALIMLDQHAVDERCRLEELMEAYFFTNPSTGLIEADVEILERPLIFDISGREYDLLEQYSDQLATWGIICKLPPRPTAAPHRSKVVVTGLPPSILERCRSEPRLIIELIRSETWRLADDDAPSRSLMPSSQGDMPWISRFHGCPRGILELLHSRACRSAIMFNDVLTKVQCEELLSRLCRCALPFQCAHGRPSMAPLVDLGVGSGRKSWQETRYQRPRSWKKWLASD